MEIWLAADDNQTLPLITEHQPVEFVCPTGAGWMALTVSGQALEAYLRPGDQAWRWRYNPGAAVGQHQVILTAGEQRYVWTLRVEPRKIDQERYTALLDDIQQVARALAYELGGAGAEGAALERETAFERGRLEEYYALVEGQLPAFERAVRRIAARPREQLIGSQARVPLGQASGIDGAALARIAQGAFDEAPPGIADELQTALRPQGGLLPQSVREERSRPGYDSYEHRLLKHALNLLTRRVRLINGLATSEATRLLQIETRGGAGGRASRVRQIVEGCTRAEQTLRELRTLPFLADVGPLPAFRGATPLLQRDPSYREVYRMWQALRQQPALVFDSPLFAIPITELPYLYETWCALQTSTALLALGGTVRHQALVQEQADDGDTLRTLALTDNAPLLVIAHGDTTLTLRYQPRYRPFRDKGKGRQADRETWRLGSLDRHTRVPDLAIEILRPGDAPQVLVFDAKYRLDEDGRGVPQDALADAYAYLGAVGCGGARAAIAALLLYPGQADEHYPSGVGAIALLPGRSDELVRVIRQYCDVSS